MYSSIIGWLRQRLTRIQIIRFLISLVLATLLWGWVTQLQDPSRERTFAAIPITVNGLSDSLVLVTTLPTAELTLSGPQSSVEDVRMSELSLNMDLSEISDPGSYRIRVTASKPGGITTESLSPSEVPIQVEEVVSQVFPLEWQGSLADDDPRRISAVTPSVSQVTVSGPTSAMSRVNKVVLPVTVTQQSSTFEALFQPYAADAENQRINDVEVLPEQVSTVVEMETRGKAVSVSPIVTGSPAEGFSVQQKSVVPETILVDGPDEVLNSLLFVNTLPVDIAGATGNVSQRIGIEELPEGVSVVDPADGIVELRVAVEDTTNTSQVIPSVPIEVNGVNPAYSATVEPETTSITIDASQSVLQSLVVSDIRAQVAGDGLGPGIYQLQVNVTLPDGVTLVGADQQVVRVTISDPQASPATGSPEPASGSGTGPSTGA